MNRLNFYIFFLVMLTIQSSLQWSHSPPFAMTNTHTHSERLAEGHIDMRPEDAGTEPMLTYKATVSTEPQSPTKD